MSSALFSVLKNLTGSQLRFVLEDFTSLKILSLPKNGQLELMTAISVTFNYSILSVRLSHSFLCERMTTYSMTERSEEMLRPL